MSTSFLRIKKLINVTNDTLCIYFEAPGDFVYAAGQYISLVLNINGKEVRRPYSLSSYKHADELPFITVKLVENGEATRYLHQHAKPGDEIEILPPNGRFILPQHIPSELFFLAAGSGISPIFALIKQALYESDSRITLMYSNRTKESSIFYSELQQLEQQFAGRLTIVWLFSNSKNLLLARLNRQLLEEHVRRYVSNKQEVLFYTCGPFYYMEMIFITLITMGFKQEQLFKETFTLPDEEDEDDGSLIVDEKAPEYIDAEVELLLDKIPYSFSLKAGETILDAALKQKIKMPYSCRNGMCSSCTSQLTAGEVYMHYNQVLTDKEMANGRILTCTAHPVSKVVKVKTG
jgi:ring-1,2-phenylacetyl-CoA epoxidase subunit PaaE